MKASERAVHPVALMAITAGHPQFSDNYRFIEQAYPLVGVGEDIRERTHFAEVSKVVLGKTVNGYTNMIDVVRARPVAKEFLPTYGRPYKEAPMGQKRSAAVYKVPVGSDVTNDNQQSDSQPGRSRAASVISLAENTTMRSPRFAKNAFQSLNRSSA